MQDKILDSERHAWDSCCESHPNRTVAQSCLENVSPFRFWSLANRFPDLVSRLHVQVRLMGKVYHGSKILMVPFVLSAKRILKV